MRRVFTHLTSGWQTGPFIHGEKRFPGRPGLSHFGREAKQAKQQKFLAHTARGSRGISFFFFFFIYFIKLIKLIEFSFVLTFLKDARERGAPDDCQSPLPGQVGPGLTA